MVYEKKRNGKRSSITKSLTVKLIPQFRDGDTKIEDNLFYSAIKLMPDSFPESIKKRFNSQVYGNDQQTDSQYKKKAEFLNKGLPASRTNGIGSLPLERFICLRKTMDHY
jgi:hypothetical protein